MTLKKGWGHRNRNVAWVNWDNIGKTKDKRGLGVREIEMFNVVLLGKWKWIGEIKKWIVESYFRIKLWFLEEFRWQN